MFILAEAGSCVDRRLKAKTEGSISGFLTRQSLSHGDPFCVIKMTNIPAHSVIEFTMNSYTCMEGCGCNSREPTYACQPIIIGDNHFSFWFNLSLTTPIYAYANAADIHIFHSSNAATRFNITYRGKYLSRSISQSDSAHAALHTKTDSLEEYEINLSLKSDKP